MKAVRDVADKLETIVADEYLALADLTRKCCSLSSHCEPRFSGMGGMSP